jgi:glycosyltransferase involved in cell wall biosynthesis
MFKNKQIALFFSYNVSLSVWGDLGMISRESRIWSFFCKDFLKTVFITYGNKDEYRLLKGFPNVTLLNNKWHLHPFLYSIALSFLYKKELKNIDIYKVNQLSGALPAIISKILYKKKLIIRCGFQLSLFFKKQKENIIKIFLALVLERIAYYLADIIIVTSHEDREYITTNHKIKSDKIRIIPNGIDTELFNKLDDIKKERGRILFVGRLIKQKNLFSLLEALKGIKGVYLVIIGKGYLKEELMHKVEEYEINVKFIDSVRNEDLPIEYNKSELFILPSLFEGNPKVLLEAMACGLPVICTDVTGINSIIKHNINGFLCNPDSMDINNAILTLISDDKVRRRLGDKARESVLREFSLDKVIEIEHQYIEELMK